ncbi:MAG: sigma factor-like helix-turn-helix DNA-binding protein [bacterium]
MKAAQAGDPMALQELVNKYEETVILKDLEGLTIEEVAESLEISIPAAKARLRRARLFLRERLQPYMEQ